MFTDLTIDNEQMMLSYGENEEDNVEINMIDTRMINFAFKLFNFKHKLFNEFSVVKYRFIDSKCQFKCHRLKTNIFNCSSKLFNFKHKVFNEFSCVLI